MRERVFSAIILFLLFVTLAFAYIKVGPSEKNPPLNTNNSRVSPADIINQSSSPYNSSSQSELRLQETKAEESNNSPEVWIEIHDVSPGWAYWRLEEIINITEKHPANIRKIVLFIIPNHSNSTPLSQYPEYSRRLGLLEDKGYVLGLHGYTHFYEEMNTSRDNAKLLIDMGLGEFEEAGLDAPSYFVPPGWVLSKEVSEYLESTFEYVYYAHTIKTPKGMKEYPSHEYTWYATDVNTALSSAMADYKNSVQVFRLTVHVGAANTPEGLAFLEEFLGWLDFKIE